MQEPAKILILTALASELDAARAPASVRVIYTGVGKINAAAMTTAALLAHRPALVVNYGSAGTLTPGLRGLVEVGRVIQRDMMAMPLAKRGETPLSEGPHEHASGFGNAVCGTGDSFVTAGDPWLIKSGIDVVDMELFAIAHVCHRHATPWRAFKFISDGANDDAAREWTANHRSGQDLFWDTLTGVLSSPLP